MAVLDRLSPTQLFLFERVREASHQRAAEVVESANLSDEQLNMLWEAKEQIQAAQIAVNLNLHDRMLGTPIVDRLRISKRLFNRFEIEHAAREANPVPERLRLVTEFKLYGGTSNVQYIICSMTNTEHPNYGIVDYLGDPITSPVLGFYG